VLGRGNIQKTQPGEDAIAKTSLQMLLAFGPSAVGVAPTTPVQVPVLPALSSQGNFPSEVGWATLLLLHLRASPSNPTDDSLGSLELDQRTHFPQFSYSASIRE